MEKHISKRQETHLGFINLEKAYILVSTYDHKRAQKFVHASSSFVLLENVTFKHRSNLNLRKSGKIKINAIKNIGDKCDY